MIAALEAQEAGAVLAILVRPDPRDIRNHESICIFHESIEVLERLLSNACAQFAMQALHAHTPPPHLHTPLVDVARPVFANVGPIRRGAVASVLVRCEARELQPLFKRCLVFGDAGVAVHHSRLQRRHGRLHKQDRLFAGDALQQRLALPVGVKIGVHHDKVAAHIDQFTECASRQARASHSHTVDNRARAGDDLVKDNGAVLIRGDPRL